MGNGYSADDDFCFLVCFRSYDPIRLECLRERCLCAAMVREWTQCLGNTGSLSALMPKVQVQISRSSILTVFQTCVCLLKAVFLPKLRFGSAHFVCAFSVLQVAMCGLTSICHRVSQRGVEATGTMIRTVLSLCLEPHKLAQLVSRS